MAYQVEVEIESLTYSGSYTVGQMGSTRIVTVTSAYGVSSVRRGVQPELHVATRLLREQVTKALSNKR